ncbi:hypothetical protein J14TS2_50340 [Bacillus sp. J14TS2]|nr:hypothetical protein J14TS2_50340 [Bacillus sp. J14TS2]
MSSRNVNSYPQAKIFIVSLKIRKAPGARRWRLELDQVLAEIYTFSPLNKNIDINIEAKENTYGFCFTNNK